MKKLILIIAIVFSGMLMQAQELWKGTTSSMNSKQVAKMFVDKLTYEENKYQGMTSYFHIDEIKIGNTPIGVDFLFNDLTGNLEKVNLKVKEGFVTSATEELKSKLTIKYGEPTTKELTSSKKNYTWIIGTTQITLAAINISVLKTVVIQYSTFQGVDDNL